jgi:hypothetical protein
MGKHQQLFLTIFQGRSDANIGFERAAVKSGIEEMLTLQRDGRKAKPYQVRQVRSVLLRHRLGVED